MVVVTEAKGHGEGYRPEWPWRCGAGVLLSSGGWKEIMVGGPRSAWTHRVTRRFGGGFSGGSYIVWGCCFCTNRLQLCHDATNGCPHQRITAWALGAGGGAGHRRCALRPSSSRRSAILQRCDAAAGLAACRRGMKRGCHLQFWGLGQPAIALFIHSWSSYSLLGSEVGRARGLC